MHLAAIARLAGDEPAIERDLGELGDILERRPHLRCGFTLTHEALDLARRRPEVFRPLAGRCEYVRTALGTIDPETLPGGVLERCLQLEADLVGRLGFDGDVLLLATTWSSHLLPRLVRNGVRGLLWPSGTLASSGVVTHLDAVIPAAPWAEQPLPVDADRLAAVWTRVGSLNELVDTTPRGMLITASEYFATHDVTGRAVIESPVRELEPDLALLERKVIRLSTRIADRTADDVIEHVVAAASVLGDPPSDTERAAVIRAAHERLITARTMMDSARRRGDDWVKASRVDWNADGVEDLHVELPQLSLVLDLRAGGSILVLDDKRTGRPLGTVVDQPLGRLLAHGPVGTEQIIGGCLELETLVESRDHVAAALAGIIADGRVRCMVDAGGQVIGLEYTTDEVATGRFGPELTLALAGAEIRVDGGAWQPLGDQALALEGHRFRLRDETGRMTLLSTMTPGNAFVRAIPGGLVAWPHWIVGGNGSYQLTIDLDP